MKIDVLGTEWKIEFRKRKHMPEGMDGYCDRTIKTICIVKNDKSSGFGNYKEYRKATIRHEIIHAFLIESGLDSNWQHAEQFGHDETMVDWFAMQFTKLYKAFEQAGAI